MTDIPNTEMSLWRTFYSPSNYPNLDEDIEVDVVVIGGGITGLTSAYLLKKVGKRVAVLEKDTIGGGTTGRTTGKVSSQHNLMYYSLLQKLGKETAQAYASANQLAVETVAEIIEREELDCDWAVADNYVYTSDEDTAKKIQAETKAAQSLGLPATYELTTPLPFAIKGAMKFTNQGKLNSQKYVQGLAGLVNGAGSFVFEHSNVTHIRDGEPARVRTSDGTVTARDVIVATNVPTLPLMARGSYCALEYPTQSYIVAGALPDDIPGMYISPDKNHYSILPITIDGQNMLLIGGEGGHLPGLSGRKSKRYQRLADYAAKHFNVESIAYKWGDRDYMAYDNLPLIGKLYSWSKHVYVGTAFRKWGLSNGTVAAMVLTDLLLGNENPWAKTFDATRLQPVKYIPSATTGYIKHMF